MASSIQNNKVTPSGYCACWRACRMWCWRAFKWLPVLLIVSIVTWSYYAYVIQLCIFTIESTIQQCFYLLFYHILLIMFVWSYWRTVFAEIQPIPEKFKLPETELEKLLCAETEDAQRTILENYAKELPIVTRIKFTMRRCASFFNSRKTKKDIIENFGKTTHVLTRTMSGSVRYCNRCVLIKPDRAHHCSICARCVLKMDHHCPWVNNCVCFFNYKFFMLFLGYALLYCIFVTSTCLPYFIRFWKGEFGNAGGAGRYHIVFAFFVALMFGISLGSLFGYHCYLVVNNRTTLEAFRAPMFRGGADKNGFSLGLYKNFKEVFGDAPKLWLVPVFTRFRHLVAALAPIPLSEVPNGNSSFVGLSLGDGCEFPVRREHQLQTFTTPPEAHNYESMGTTRSSYGDGIVYPLPQHDEDTESLLSAERWERWGERARPFDDRGSSSCDDISV